MDVRGKTIQLNPQTNQMWSDKKSQIHLSFFGEDTHIAVVPENPEVDVSNIEKAIEMNILIVLDPGIPEKKRVRKVKSKAAPTGEPRDLLRLSANHIKQVILPRITERDTLDAMLNLELGAHNSYYKTRRTVVNAIMNRMKRLGFNETQIIQDGKEKPLFVRRYEEERGHKEPDDTPVEKAVREEREERRRLGLGMDSKR